MRFQRNPAGILAVSALIMMATSSSKMSPPTTAAATSDRRVSTERSGTAGPMAINPIGGNACAPGPSSANTSNGLVAGVVNIHPSGTWIVINATPGATPGNTMLPNESLMPLCSTPMLSNNVTWTPSRLGSGTMRRLVIPSWMAFPLMSFQTCAKHVPNTGSVGGSVGDTVGVSVGEAVGLTVGDTVGDAVGLAVGVWVGLALGLAVGLALGLLVGDADGLTVGV